MTQYVACKFRETDTRSYTYHNDGEPLAPGDWAKVEDRNGDGWKRVLVVMATDEAPSFPTKPILGKVTDEDIDDRIIAATPSADALNSPIAF